MTMAMFMCIACSRPVAVGGALERQSSDTDRIQPGGGDSSPDTQPSVPNTSEDEENKGRLVLSSNKRYLSFQNGEPFFYLADTAWELFHRLDREDAERYLRKRAEQGFTVIQAVILAEIDGLNTGNPYGARPLLDNDPVRPNEAYFEHVDFIMEKAQSLGLVIGLLPTWGDKVNKAWGVGPVVFDDGNAEWFGRFLGKRYGDKPVIWILGGDRDPGGRESVWRAMAKGIEDGVNEKIASHTALMTYHPPGGATSAQWFHDDDWLDFNMQQNGHCADTDVWNRLRRDYDRVPVKPVMDGEPLYEEHPICFDPGRFGRSTDVHVRRFAYHDLFSGSHGFTYGCHAVWQMFTPERGGINGPMRPWDESLDLPGARQMKHVRALMMARPFFTRIPDNSIVTSDLGNGNDRISATRDSEGRYALVYSERGKAFEVNLGAAVKAERVVSRWFDPRTGKVSGAEELSGTGRHTFTPPSSGPGNDWVLILDDKSAEFRDP